MRVFRVRDEMHTKCKAHTIRAIKLDSERIRTIWLLLVPLPIRRYVICVIGF